jgi:hypothetical protein
LYLADVAWAVRQFREDRRPQILFRRCPVDFSDRYDACLRQHPEIAVSNPAWLPPQDGDWSQVLPTVEDVNLLANIVQHCSLVVNMGSTMAVDFAVLGKPAVYINYDATSNGGLKTSTKNIYRMPHFKSVIDHQPVYWAESREGLTDVLAHALSRPAEKADARRRWLSTLVMEPLAEASQRCCATLQAVAERRLPMPGLIP